MARAQAIGVDVYGPDDKQIGKIDDILMDHDGKAQTVVIGVGGFLGFGKKDVAVPFSAMQWKTEPRKVPAAEQSPTNPVASTSGQTAGPPPMKETDPAATEASQGYPDRAILDVTLAQLKAAPDFQYGPNPVAESEAPRAPETRAAKPCGLRRTAYTAGYRNAAVLSRPPSPRAIASSKSFATLGITASATSWRAASSIIRRTSLRAISAVNDGGS